jgi:hypothetical protein
MDFEIFWNDLTEEAKERLRKEGFQNDDNMEFIPIAILVQEPMTFEASTEWALDKLMGGN